ncbi:hypothetical protein V1478_008011 [Vespula squamosa]|uniref:Uncharacterized protein n=1 Tax=Vespula squamosa TaxID=30214 RepID=A0ABD2AXJ7_VESSQ
MHGLRRGWRPWVMAEGAELTRARILWVIENNPTNNDTTRSRYLSYLVRVHAIEKSVIVEWGMGMRTGNLFRWTFELKPLSTLNFTIGWGRLPHTSVYSQDTTAFRISSIKHILDRTILFFWNKQEDVKFDSSFQEAFYSWERSRILHLYGAVGLQSLKKEEG